MKKLQYIINEDNQKQSVIIPIDEYEESVKNQFENDLILINGGDFENVKNFIKKQLVLSVFDKTLELLKLNVKEQKSICNFLKVLVKVLFLAHQFGDNSKDYSVKLKDEVVKDLLKSKGKENKMVQRYRKKIESHSKNLGVGIIEYYQLGNDGSIYKLNFIKSVENAIKEFINETNISSRDFIKLVEFSSRFDLSDRDKTNSVYSKLLNSIKKHLNQLPRDVRFNYSSATVKSRYYHEYEK